jgi:hypothetical protein
MVEREAHPPSTEVDPKTSISPQKSPREGEDSTEGNVEESSPSRQQSQDIGDKAATDETASAFATREHLYDS